MNKSEIINILKVLENPCCFIDAEIMKYTQPYCIITWSKDGKPLWQNRPQFTFGRPSEIDINPVINFTGSIDASETLRQPEHKILVNQSDKFYVSITNSSNICVSVGSHKIEAIARTIAWLEIWKEMKNVENVS